MRARREVMAVILSLVILGIGFSVSRSQERSQRNDLAWQVVTSGMALISVCMADDGRRGWVVGVKGTILATEDGGGHWIPQTSSTSNDLWGVAFAADGLRGWVVGVNGTILATEDGGGHWNQQTSSTSNDLWGVVLAADGLRGWAVGEKGTILATEDGGAIGPHRAARPPAISEALSSPRTVAAAGSSVRTGQSSRPRTVAAIGTRRPA
jgi:photosystem II stability/assembly factor-like uncharacterized protein